MRPETVAWVLGQRLAWLEARVAGGLTSERAVKHMEREASALRFVLAGLAAAGFAQAPAEVERVRAHEAEKVAQRRVECSCVRLCPIHRPREET